jgi:acetyl-CoA C-acetyltransferase
MSQHAFIYDAIRTPRGRGKVDGSLYEVKPIHLATTVLDALAERTGIDSARVDEVIMGCVNPLGEQGSVLPKSAAQLAGWAENVAGLQLNRFCASGLEAINIAAAKVVSGQSDLIVAGGVESMSRVPMGSDGGPWLEDPEVSVETSFISQGISADLIATIGGISRAEVDAYAAASHARAATAQRAGHFARSIVPVLDRNGLPILVSDELIRPETTLDTLAKLKPSFVRLAECGFGAVALGKYSSIDRLDHVHTAGNASGIADGASAVLIGNEGVGRELGLTPRAQIVAAGVVSTEPTIMLTGPGPATRRVLDRQCLSPDDVDLYECNEAFAAVVLRFMSELGVDHKKVNVNGGAIALGHPLGATGGILVGTLIDELERRSLKRGVVTLCAGGGMGIATLVERV